MDALGSALSPELAEEIAAEAWREGGLTPHLPGRVYERARSRDAGARRADAVYYTPPHLTEFAVERALGPLCEGRSPGRVLELRILDPACGGGAFLLAALAFLEARCPGRRRELVRCLYGIDVDPQAAAVARLALSVAAPESRPDELARAITVGDALRTESAPAGAFDAVVTNPPWGLKRFRLCEEDRHFYRASYVSARGGLDPFALFVERAHTLLRPGGRWGMVLPDVILLKNHEALRSLMLESSAIDWIAHAGRAFEGVNLDAVVMVGRRLGDAVELGDHKVSIWHSLPADWRVRPPRLRRQRQAVFARLPGRCFNLHLGGRDLALFDRLFALPSLGERFEVHEGVHSGNARAKLFLPERPAGGAPCDSAPIVVGRGEVSRYQVEWSGTWLDLSPRAIDRARGDYANLGRPEWHRRPKIVVRRTGDHLVAAWDSRGLYVSNNLFVVLPHERMAAMEQRAWVAVLNSRLLTWCFRALVPRRGRLFAEIKIQHLVALPQPPRSAWSPVAMRALAQLATRASSAPGPEARARAELAIDRAVERIYRLSPTERRQIRIGA